MKKWMYRVSKLAPAVFVAVGLLIADQSYAERRCEKDPKLTGRTCSELECLVLQGNVDNTCKNPRPKPCNDLEGCSLLKQEKEKWLICYEARSIINARCWSGGDLGHQQAAAEAIQHVGTCNARIAMPRPIGCEEPCPF